MAECLLLKTGGAYGSDDCTASKAQVLSGYTAITSDSDDEPVQGTISSKSAATYYATTSDQTIAANQYLSGAQTIKGLTQTNLSGANIKPGVTIKINNGNADVWSVPSTMTSKAAATYYATTSDQTIAANQYLSGVQTIKKLTQTNLSGANIKPGVTIKINNGNTDVWSVASTMESQGATTYYPTTSNQTIASGKYLSGTQTINKITQTNLSAGNIKNGTTVKVNNGNADVWSVTGTFTGQKKAISAVAVRGFGESSQYYVTSEEDSFTMPLAGVVYYGGMTAGSYNSTVTCEIYVNNVLKDSRNITSGDYYWRPTMVNKSLSVAKNDVIKVKCTAPSGGSAMAFMQAVCIY